MCFVVLFFAARCYCACCVCCCLFDVFVVFDRCCVVLLCMCSSFVAVSLCVSAMFLSLCSIVHVAVMCLFFIGGSIPRFCVRLCLLLS